MNSVEEAKVRAAAAYNAASDYFDHPANTFWDRFGRATVGQLGLRPGDAVLDVCCGSGASAIPAAEAVGSTGRVVGVDLAENLLQLGRAKASDRRLANIEFRVGDMLSLAFPDSCFDATVCVFGIFFVPDMAEAARELWRTVRPGGKLAITTWGPRFFEPANSVFWNIIREEAVGLYKSFNPWDRINNPAGLRSMLNEAGIEAVDISAEDATHSVGSPDAWWMMLMGSGYRGTIDQLDTAAFERVREGNMAFIRQSGLAAVEANVVYAVAVKPE